MKLKKDLLIQKMGKTHVVYDNETATLHELNETAFEILMLIKKGKNKSEILNALGRKYKVKPEQARRDLADYFADLKKADLIVGR